MSVCLVCWQCEAVKLFSTQANGKLEPTFASLYCHPQSGGTNRTTGAMCVHLPQSGRRCLLATCPTTSVLVKCATSCPLLVQLCTWRCSCATVCPWDQRTSSPPPPPPFFFHVVLRSHLRDKLNQVTDKLSCRVVEFDSVESAQRAIDELHDVDLGGRAVLVREVCCVGCVGCGVHVGGGRSVCPALQSLVRWWCCDRCSIDVWAGHVHTCTWQQNMRANFRNNYHVLIENLPGSIAWWEVKDLVREIGASSCPAPVSSSWRCLVGACSPMHMLCSSLQQPPWRTYSRTDGVRWYSSRWLLMPRV